MMTWAINSWLYSSFVGFKPPLAQKVAKELKATDLGLCENLLLLLLLLPSRLDIWCSINGGWLTTSNILLHRLVSLQMHVIAGIRIWRDGNR